MKKTITLALLTALLVITGCASTNELYYESVQKTAEANAKAVQAKFDALSKIASSGDGQAASAAVMALALTSTPNAQPIPQKSEAIQWASILASPVTSLGMMWMQADSAKTMARYNAQVDLASVAADAQTQQALYGSFSDISSAGFTAVGNVDYTPFIDGMVNLGTTGMDNLTTLGTAGFDANTNIATAGFDANTDIAIAGITQVGATAEDGLNATANVGLAGMTNLTTLGTNGMTNLVTLGTNGLNTAQTLGVQGMLGMHETTKSWVDYAASINADFKDMLANEQSGCVVTTNASNQIVVTCN